MQPLLQKQCVGAQVHELPALDDLFYDLSDVLVDEGLSARYRNDRRATFVHRAETFFDTQPAVEDLLRMIDLAAARAREIAA
jgi:hypothetical protein